MVMVVNSWSKLKDYCKSLGLVSRIVDNCFVCEVGSKMVYVEFNTGVDQYTVSYIKELIHKLSNKESISLQYKLWT